MANILQSRVCLQTRFLSDSLTVRTIDITKQKIIEANAMVFKVLNKQ